jgi:hypothetical protein
MVPKTVHEAQTRDRTEAATTNTNREGTMDGGESDENSRTMTIDGSENVAGVHSGNVAIAMGTGGMKIAPGMRTDGGTAAEMDTGIPGGREAVTGIGGVTGMIGDDGVERLGVSCKVGPLRVYVNVLEGAVSTVGFGKIEMIPCPVSKSSPYLSIPRVRPYETPVISHPA